MEQKHEITIAGVQELPIVEEVKLEAHDRDTGYKAIVDKNTMQTLCVVKNDNMIIQHQDVLKEVNKLKNYLIKRTVLSHNGTMMMIELTEREPRKVELLPNDFLECGARVYNKYDRSRGLSVAGWGNRVVCANGMVAPRVGQQMQIYAYGTNEFSAELEAQIEASLDAWTNVKDLIQLSHEKMVHTKDVINNFSFLPSKYMDIITKNLKDQETVFDVWNEYTRTITHDIGKDSKNSENIIYLQKRSNKILQLVHEEL